MDSNEVDSSQSEFCRDEEFPLMTIHVHFYAPTSWTDDEENQRIHNILAKEIEHFRSVAQDLVNGICLRDAAEQIRIGIQYS